MNNNTKNIVYMIVALVLISLGMFIAYKSGGGFWRYFGFLILASMSSSIIMNNGRLFEVSVDKTTVNN